MHPFADKKSLIFGLLALGSTLQGSSRATVDAAILGPPVHTVTLTWGAANLALEPPYDTVQLQAIARAATGVVVQIPVSYTTADSAISVSPTGLVTARKSTVHGSEWAHPAHVVASVRQGGRTLSDTAIIQVTPHPLPAPLATLSIHPQPGGLTSAHGNLGVMQTTMPFAGDFPFFATIATGNPATDTLCNAQGCQKYPLVVHFTSSDPGIASIDLASDASPWFHAFRPGRVTLTVSTIAYGVRKVDSLPFSVGYNQRITEQLYADSGRAPVRIAFFRASPPYGVGVHILVTNYTHEPVEVCLPAHGAHFARGNVTIGTIVDTLADEPGALKKVVIDSVGTHILQYRGLHTGATLSDTITVLPYP